jgi:hypothetical protein
MDKPITILHQEFMENIATLINESHLPAFVIRSLLKEVVAQLDVIVEKQYITDKTNYDKASGNNKET